jgi:PITH domain
MSGHGHAHGGPCGQEHADGCGHGHGHHDHDHDGEGDTGGEEWSLYARVDMGRVVCLNEAEPDSGPRVLRPWHDRLNTQLPVLSSDADEQLLLCIPFTAPVKIKSICVVGAGDRENPADMSAFVNVETLDFDAAEATEPTQKWELVEDNARGEVEYPTRFTRFQNVSKLWLFFSRNFGADQTRVMYIGLKGEYTLYKREAVRSVYESRPLAAPRKINEETNRMGI